MPSRAVFLLIVGGVLVALAGLGAQSTPRPPAQFRGSSLLVPVDVRVLDSRGRPIPDLTPSDFTVLEDDIPQVIEQFHRLDLGSRVRWTCG
jgi:hypothetical protein